MNSIGYRMHVAMKRSRRNRGEFAWGIFRASFVVVVAFTCVHAVDADTVPVFFAGGQSNAKPDWSNSIENELREGYDPRTVVVNQRHNGNWLSQWSANGIMQANYDSDLAVILETLEQIRLEGDTPEFRGLFWFQGESDTGGRLAVENYEQRFTDMKRAYENNFSRELFATIMVIDMDPAYERPTVNTQGRIDDLRAIQMALGEDSLMTSVDSRGYSRYDAWHLTISEQQRLGRNAAFAFMDAVSVPEPSLILPCFATSFLFACRRRRQ